MKLGRLAMVGLALSLFGSSAFANNGSNFWHYTNGTDYFFGFLPSLPYDSATWRCFPGAINHAPTKVVNAADANVGTYSSKIDAMFYDVDGNDPVSGAMILPYIAVWSNVATCATVTTGGPQFLYFTGAGVGPVVGGPGVPANPATNRFFFPLLSVGGAAPPPFINSLKLSIIPSPGFPSAITIPEGETTVLSHPDPAVVNPAGGGQYFIGSVDDRRVCSYFSNTGMFIPTVVPSFGKAYFLINFFFLPVPIEWGSEVGTIDATCEVVQKTAGPGASGLNAHAGLGVPYDAGNNGVVSMSGSSIVFPQAGENFGIQSYDANNAFGGSNHVSLINFAGFDPGYPGIGGGGIVPCPTAGGFIGTILGTGGPGGPALGGPLPQAPRSSGKFDFVTNNLLANPIWIFATKHGVSAGGNNYPQYPAPAAIGGSTGNNGGAMIGIPLLPALPGLEFCVWQLCLNPGGGLAVNAANGHSHTNTAPVYFAP